MDIEILTSFFMWCTIINGGMLILSAMFLILAPDFAYRMQSRWIPISRQTFDVVYYATIGFFKVLFIFFNVVPWAVLLIIA